MGDLDGDDGADGADGARLVTSDSDFVWIIFFFLGFVELSVWSKTQIGFVVFFRVWSFNLWF